MAPSWKIHPDLPRNLTQAGSLATAGFLIGKQTNGHVLACASYKERSVDKGLAAIHGTFPAGTTLLGLFTRGSAQDLVSQWGASLDKFPGFEGSLLVASITGDAADESGVFPVTFNTYEVSSKALTPFSPQDSSYSAKEYTTVHLAIPSLSIAVPKGKSVAAYLDEQIAALQGPSSFIFFTDAKALVPLSAGAQSAALAGRPFKDLLGEADGSNAAASGSGKGKKGHALVDDLLRESEKVTASVVRAKHVFKATTDAKQTAPLFDYVPSSGSVTAIPLPVSVVALVDDGETVGDVMAGVCRAIVAQMTHIIARWEAKQDATPKVLHFASRLTTDIAAVFMLQGDAPSDASLESYRKELHELLCVPLERPVFRLANVRTFDAPESSSDSTLRLRNTHIGLKRTVKDGKLFVVDGDYDYYHYMQDKFDDNKWGCAYRSLQTICSWFVLQGYSQRLIPTHREIQEILVRVDGKPESFIGSKQWIGSQEMGIVLMTWFEKDFEVQNRFIPGVIGSDMPSQARELARHFTLHGTPVMIGGNNLAHTILGIDYNDRTGDIKFLILDPHYIGPEDIKTIQDKGWCAWKGPEFWNPRASYNLLLPQRPKLF